MPLYVIDRIKEIMDNNDIKSFSDVGLYGLTYKPNVDDTRESPTIQLLNNLDEDSRDKIKVYDPMIQKKMYKSQVEDLQDFIDDIKLLVVMVDHREILESEKILENKIILDTKNVIKSLPTYKL